MSASNLRGRFYNWLTSWTISFRRKDSTSSVSSTTMSNCSNFSSGGSTTSALKSSTRLTSSNIKKVVRFAENDGKVLTQVLNNNERSKNVVRPLDESLEDVYINDDTIRGFICVKNLESERQVLVRYTDDNWEGFKQVKPKRVERITDTNGKKHMREVKEKNGKLSRRSKQVNPCASTTNEKTYFFKIQVDQARLNRVELVIISSLDDVIDTNHQQCYSFKCVRQSWEANGTSVCSKPRDVNSSLRQL